MNFLSKKRRLILQAGVGSLMGMPLPLLAQGAYPNRPIKIIVPFPPGNSIDIMVRLVQGKMASILGQSIIVENIVTAASIHPPLFAARVLLHYHLSGRQKPACHIKRRLQIAARIIAQIQD